MANTPPKDKRFESGEIVFWCHQCGHKYSVHYGIVDEQYGFNVYIDYLAPRERRRIYSDYIKGVPIDEFETEQRFHKLPKGWTYNTKLFEIKYDDFTQEEHNLEFDFDNPDTIGETLKEEYDKGFLVKRAKIFHGSIESEITKDGWRIHKGYPQDWGINRTPNYITVTCSKVYRTYNEAQKEVDKHIAEYKRQAALSDYDWSVEQIDKVLGYYKNIYDLTDSEIKQYRDWILSQDGIENIELRIHFGNLEWKNWNIHKKWHGIETNM